MSEFSNRVRPTYRKPKDVTIAVSEDDSKLSAVERHKARNERLRNNREQSKNWWE